MQKQSEPKVSNLMKKLDDMYAELKSDEHYEDTPSVAYGRHDPFDVPVSPCEVCSKHPSLEQPQASSRWLYVCKCGRRPSAVRKAPWQACIEWNSINLNNTDYRALPLFGLKDLSPEPAHKRLAGMRRNLELRKNIAQIEGTVAILTERSIGIEQPGKGYTRKLEAYLMWCLWGLRLTKVAKSSSPV
jgi:hypothetical protein